MTIEMSKSPLSNAVATSHIELLNIWRVAGVIKKLITLI